MAADKALATLLVSRGAAEAMWNACRAADRRGCGMLTVAELGRAFVQRNVILGQRLRCCFKARCRHSVLWQQQRLQEPDDERIGRQVTNSCPSAGGGVVLGCGALSGGAQDGEAEPADDAV